MKKVVVLLAVAALLSTSAYAGIRNSKHDLSSTSATGGAAGTIKSTNVDELCVFCHTPHGGAIGEKAPLWNRSLGSLTFAATDLYNSATLEAATAPTTVLAKVNASDAKLCISCHDGGSLAGGLNNPPASNGNVQPTFGAANATSGNTDILDGSGVATNALRNDHPIGMVYNTAAGTDTELYEIFESTNLSNGTLPLYDGGVMWCSSCHDVHNPDKGTPFLNMTNSGSAMCLSCHNK